MGDKEMAKCARKVKGLNELELYSLAKAMKVDTRYGLDYDWIRRAAVKHCKKGY